MYYIYIFNIYIYISRRSPTSALPKQGSTRQEWPRGKSVQAHSGATTPGPQVPAASGSETTAFG